MTKITDLARASIRHYLETGEVMAAPERLDVDLQRRAGAFVSLHEQGELRGCIGTIAPTQASLAEEVIRNAVSAATLDPRFEPVGLGEVDGLEISVDVLSEAVVEADLARLDPKQFGIIVSAGDGRQGVLLPDLEGVDTAEEQIRICREKGEIGPDEPVEIRKFTVERYI
jgi:AmmeMemoRadiSam system protein A